MSHLAPAGPPVNSRRFQPTGSGAKGGDQPRQGLTVCSALRAVILLMTTSPYVSRTVIHGNALRACHQN